MCLIERDTGGIFSEYVGFCIMYRTGSTDGIEAVGESVFERAQWS